MTSIKESPGKTYIGTQEYTDEFGNKLTKVVLRVKDKKYSGRVFRVYPVMDRSGRLLKDQPDIPEAERPKYLYVVDNETNVAIWDGYTLNLEDPKDNITWGWLRHCTHIIAPSKEEARRNARCIFYVENTVEEAKKTISMERLIIEYKSKIFRLDEKERRDLLRCANEFIEDKTKEEVEALLLKRIDEEVEQKTVDKPGTVTFYLNNPDRRRRRILALRLIEAGKIVHDRGMYFAAGEAVASSLDELMKFLADPKRRHMVELWMQEIYGSAETDEAPEAESDTPAPEPKTKRKSKS